MFRSRWWCLDRKFRLSKDGDKDKATLDIIGSVIDEVKRQVGQARETVKLNLDSSLGAKQKTIQYTTSFSCPPASTKAANS